MVDRAIGIFDSGIGGLTVLKEIIKIMPCENIIYYGDTAHTPYGNKSPETILNYSRRIIKFLISKNVKLIVIACNTVSANCFEKLQQEFEIPIIEVLSAGVNSALDATKNKMIGIIGTESTIESHAYKKYMLDIDKSVKVIEKACPLFVPLAEEGWAENKIAYDTAKIYLDEFKETKIDTLVLGCTHYPLFINCIKKILPDVNIVNPAENTATNVRNYLAAKKILRNNGNFEVIFFTSDNSKKFMQVCNKVLNKNYDAQNFVQQVLD